MMNNMTQNLIPSLESMPIRSKILEQPEAIAILHDEKYRVLIRYFMQQKNTIKNAAEHTKQTVQRTYNYVTRLLETGFLELTDNQARGGKAIKYYAATADDYFVPFAHTQALDYADLIEQELRPLQHQMLRAFSHHLANRNPLEWGTRLFKDPDGFTHLSFTPKENWQSFECLTDLLHPDAPALINFWGKIKLPDAQAKALQLELMQLWSKYYFVAHLEKNPDDLKTFAVGLSLVPV
jgi:hypothetical protein